MFSGIEVALERLSCVGVKDVVLLFSCSTFNQRNVFNA